VTKVGDHAVVLGAIMGGLLAARVLMRAARIVVGCDVALPEVQASRSDSVPLSNSYNDWCPIRRRA
jgi:hypothetical protein